MGLNDPGSVSSLGLALWVLFPWQDISIDITYHCIAYLTKEWPLLFQQSTWWCENMNLITLPLSTPTQFSINPRWLSCSTRLYGIWSLIRFLFLLYYLIIGRPRGKGGHVNYLICTGAKIWNSKSQIWYLKFKCPSSWEKGRGEGILWVPLKVDKWFSGETDESQKKETVAWDKILSALG